MYNICVRASHRTSCPINIGNDRADAERERRAANARAQLVPAEGSPADGRTVARSVCRTGALIFIYMIGPKGRIKKP